MNSSENSPSTSEAELQTALQTLAASGLRFHYLMWLPEGEWWLVCFRHGDGMQQMFHAKAPTILSATYQVINKWQKFLVEFGWPPTFVQPTHFTKSSPLELDIKI